MANKRLVGSVSAARIVGIAIVLAAGVAEADPQISFGPTLGFTGGEGTQLGGGPPGEAQFGSFFVQDTGTTTLVVTDMMITGADASVFAFDPGDPLACSGRDCAVTYAVAPGQSRGFQLVCTPIQPGVFTATLVVTSNATSGANTFVMTCTGNRAPVISVSPSNGLDFGVVHFCLRGDVCGPPCTGIPTTQALTITNTAAPPSELDFYVTWLVNSEDITVNLLGEPDNPIALAAGQSYTIEISFHPQGNHESPGSMSLVSRFPGQAPVVIPFHAEAGAGRMAFDTSNLGTAVFGQTLVTSITGHNEGTSCLEMSEFHLQGDCQPIGDVPLPAVLAAGQSFTQAVACTPTLENAGSVELELAFPFEGQDIVFHDFQCVPTGGALTNDVSQILFQGPFEVAVGTTGTQQINVINAGPDPTQLTAFASSDPQFTAALVTGSLPVTLGSGDSVPVNVTFTPSAAATSTATIEFSASFGAGHELSVTGDGIVVASNVMPAARDFGAVALPDAPSQTFQLHNGGDRALTVAAITLDLPNDFTVGGLSNGDTIAPGGTQSFTVTATPTTLGQRHATLVVQLDRGADLTIPLDAFAGDPQLVVTPSNDRLELGQVDVDVGAHQGHVTLHNASGGAMTIATCTITGDPELTVASSCAASIASGATADLTIAFDPSSEAESTGMLTITGTGFATGALRIALHGTGFNQHVALSATTVGFADTFRHPAAPVTQIISVQNTSSTALSLTAIAVGGDGFSLVGPSAATIAPGEHQDITVGFAPQSAGMWSGHLTLGNADDPAIARVALTGRGIDRTVTVAPLAFDLGTVKIGATARLSDAAGGPIVIRNTDPTATFVISSTVLTGDPAFHLVEPSRTTLAPGEQATIDLELTATAAGPLSAAIDVFFDGDPTPQAHITVAAQAVAAPPHGGGCTTSGSAGLPLVVALGWLLRRRATEARRSSRRR